MNDGLEMELVCGNGHDLLHFSVYMYSLEIERIELTSVVSSPFQVEPCNYHQGMFFY